MRSILHAPRRVSARVAPPRRWSSALVAATLALTGGTLTATAADTEPEAKKPSGRIARITISGAVHEGAPPLQLFAATSGASLRDITGAIRKAATDDATAGLVLRIRSASVGWTQTQELRRALLEYRRSGKPSWCHLETAGTRAYLLASACGEVSMLPTGLLEIPGVVMRRMYVRSLLEKLGVRVEELRVGRYKSAAEMMTRDGPSDAVREESHAILDDLYRELVDSIAECRDLPRPVVRALIDEALFSAEAAKRAKLVDRIEYPDEFLARVRATDDGPRDLVDIRTGHRLELQTGGFAGLMTLMNEILGGPRRRRATRNPKIAIVHGVGPVVTGGGQESLFGGVMMASRDMAKLFREVREDPSVRAVVFRVDSPGGSALASEMIWREVTLTAAAKPVVVSMGDLAASGGYYVSCGASWIVAERGTLTGSIGVIGAAIDLTDLQEAIGLRYTTFSRGRRAELMAPSGRLSDEGREVMMGLLREVYDQFLDRVATGRRMPREAVASLAEGRVWTGAQALRHDLVDEIGGIETALAKARELSGAPQDAEILSLPRAKTLFELLSDAGVHAAVRATCADALLRLPRGIRPLARQLEWIASAREDPRMAVFPELILLD